MNSASTSGAKSPTKGKQATRGDKQILVENEQTINFYFRVFSISNGAYLLLRFLLFWQSFTSKFIILYLLTLTVSGLGYYFINYMGKPIRDFDGSIIGAGSDLNMPGHISEYAKDVILFAAIVHLLTLVSDYFWLLLIVVPVYVFYILWKNFLGPWFFAPAPEHDLSLQQQDQKKQREKRRIIRR
jgi:hypothetical protein